MRSTPTRQGAITCIRFENVRASRAIKEEVGSSTIDVCITIPLRKLGALATNDRSSEKRPKRENEVHRLTLTRNEFKLAISPTFCISLRGLISQDDEDAVTQNCIERRLVANLSETSRVESTLHQRKVSGRKARLASSLNMRFH